MTTRRSGTLWIAGLLAIASAAAMAQAGDEAPPSFTASALLASDVRQGPHHTVEERVKTEGFFHEFEIASDYGELKAIGLSQLTTRLNEIRALASLDEVSKSEVFLKSAGGAVVNVGKSTVKVVTDPVETAKGVGSGVKRLGVNLGRMSKRAVDSAGNDSEAAGPKENAAEGTANAVLGVSGAMRRWARKVGADPYTTNPVLFQALKDIGRIDAAGNIATKVVLPIPAIVTTSASVGDLVWGKDPEELRKINEQRLREIGASDGTASRLFRSRVFTLTYQTRLVAALHAVRAPACADYVESAAGARTEREALFFVESAELLQALAARERVARLLPDSRALVAARGSLAIALLPLDWVRWTTGTNTVARQLANRARQELNAKELRFALTGTATPRMQAALSEAGWSVVKAGPGE
jgi:hypothetical protein